MTETPCTFIYDEFGNTREIGVNTCGSDALRNNYINKGTAFSEDERTTFGLEGLLPPATRSLQQQVRISQLKADTKDTDVGRYIFVRSLFDRNVTLAHALISSDIEQYMKIIYTPTVGIASQNYSSMFRMANGLHFYPGNIQKAEEILRSFAHRDIRVAVVTDNQGVLGIGDQGVGGIAICLGKLMLYTQLAGIAPWHCLPVSLDVGTDNMALLDDPYYLGWKHTRLKDDEYIDFVRKFARAFKAVFPNALCQWEDFSKHNAFEIRDAYLHDLISFNDDIQGTGAVALSAVLSAMRIKSERIEEQVFLVYGAGAGGVGVAEQILTALMQAGLSEVEALSRIFVMNRKGLLTRGNFEPYQSRFVRDAGDIPWAKDGGDLSLGNVIRNAGVTVLIGASGQAGHFSRDIVQSVAQNTKRPVIMPLSNPTEHSEAVPSDILNWTEGRALVATGSPFSDVNFAGQHMKTGQCNNVFIFPGVGVGVLASGAREVLPSFFTAAARAVAEYARNETGDVLMPSIKSLREVNLRVANAVGMTAISENVSGPCAFSKYKHEGDEARLKVLINNMQWRPVYLPLTYGLK